MMVDPYNLYEQTIILFLNVPSDCREHRLLWNNWWSIISKGWVRWCWYANAIDVCIMRSVGWKNYSRCRFKKDARQ